MCSHACYHQAIKCLQVLWMLSCHMHVWPQVGLRFRRLNAEWFRVCRLPWSWCKDCLGVCGGVANASCMAAGKAENPQTANWGDGLIAHTPAICGLFHAQHCMGMSCAWLQSMPSVLTAHMFLSCAQHVSHTQFQLALWSDWHALRQSWCCFLPSFICNMWIAASAICLQ